MDIRDFKEEPRAINDGKYLEEIYSLQKVLIDHYVGIEGLPPYPVNVNTKSSQVLLKDFTGRVVEELAEGYESHLLVLELYNNNKYLHDLTSDDKVIKMVINHLQNLNEEQADAMHFMTELLIYANIQPEDIRSWINQKGAKSLYRAIYDEEDILDMAMTIGYINIMDSLNSDFLTGRDIDFSKWLNEKQLSYIRGGLKMNLGSLNTFDISEKFLWAVTYAINISRNCLKNKPWKQSGVMTDETLYQSKVVEAFVYMAGYFRFLGMTSYDVYYLYFKKNLANQFRIRSKY
jgi:hypothetical protein